MRKLWYVVFIGLTACGGQRKEKVVVNNTPTEIETPTIAPSLEDYFVDSLKVGRASFNKVELAQYRTYDSVYVKLNFYTRQGNSWLLKNKFHFLKDPIRPADPQLADFNNDGYQDLSYASGVPARGINDLRMLFVFS